MASTSRVFEVMIHHVEADAALASGLQKRLYHDGIRAGVAALSTTKEVSITQTARHAICFVGPAFNAHVPYDQFDSVFISPGVEVVIRSSKEYSSYQMLVNRILGSHAGAPISARELRRMTQASYDAIAAQFTDVWFDSIPGEPVETFPEASATRREPSLMQAVAPAITRATSGRLALIRSGSISPGQCSR